MKKLILFACALCMSVCAMAQSEFYVYKKDGRSVQFTIANVDSISFTAPANGHEWVDLGLSVKWATCNVGATAPEEYGNYYAWGETKPKTTYTWDTYKWCNGSKTTLTKYNTSSSYGTVDNKTVLELADDAARANWGGGWRMPTDAEWTELRKNCTWTWTSDYNGTGVAGQIVTSKTNGNSIFLPAAGYRIKGDLRDVGSNGNYWSNSLCTDSPDEAMDVLLFSKNVFKSLLNRYYGLSVRPVLGDLRAATVPAVIAVSADGASVQRIVFDTGGMTLQRKAEAGDVNGVRCVLFGTMEQTTTALAEAGKTTIYAYPNPVQNYLRIEGATTDATCTVYDLQGRALLHSAAQHIDVTNLQQGSYLLKINNQIIKFIKK